jgi:hypothetical protein
MGPPLIQGLVLSSNITWLIDVTELSPLYVAICNLTRYYLFKEGISSPRVDPWAVWFPKHSFLLVFWRFFVGCAHCNLRESIDAFSGSSLQLEPSHSKIKEQ